MDQLDKSIGQQLREITHTDDKTRFPVMSGVVKVYDEDANTVTVLLTLDDDSAPTEDVTLSVIMGNDDGVYGIPAEGTDCLVGEIDGPGKWQLLWASKYKKWVIKADVIEMNGGGLKGLPILDKVDGNFKKLHDYIKNTLEPLIKSTITAVGAGSSASGPTAVSTTWNPGIAGQDITFDDMENTKIKQG